MSSAQSSRWKRRSRRTWMPLALAALVSAGCSGRVMDPGNAGTGGDDAPPEEVCDEEALLAPESYATKVKSLLTGLPLTDDELSQLRTAPDSLGELIDSWAQSPDAAERLRGFFATAFQQTELDLDTFSLPLGFNLGNTGRFENPRSDRLDVLFNQNFAESFARTAYEIAMSGRPWTDVITTDSYMMTTAQIAYLAYTDDVVVDDQERASVRTTTDHFPTINLVADAADAPPLAEALDPQSERFATFYHPNLGDLDPSCEAATGIQIDTTQNAVGEWRLQPEVPSFWVFSAMLGRARQVDRRRAGCRTGAANTTPAFARSDFNDWRLVRIAKPETPERATIFYDLPSLRQADVLRIHTDRIGFFSTPGFQGTWPTNEDNSSRVTLNQILIVALGASFTGNAVTDFTPEGLDTEHAAPGTECYGCHQTLDPMREFVRGSWTNFYGQQLDVERANVATDFVFGGVRQAGSGVADLATILANHPQFARGWTQKLCYWANSAQCREGEEFDRVVAAFVESGHDFKVLLRELLSSPLVTGHECVDGVDSGTAATIARRSLFCDQLSSRLGVLDICGAKTLPAERDRVQRIIAAAVSSVPDDSFSRAEVPPVVISETSMFARSNREATCVAIAERALGSVFSEQDADTVLRRLVIDVMNIPLSDARYTEALQILTDHVAEATALDASESLALQSAFVVACMSPRAAGVGF